LYEKLKLFIQKKESISQILVISVSVIIALLIGAIILLVSNMNPIQAYLALLEGSFGNITYIGDTLARSTPIIFTGLAVSVAFKGGLFNIGVEGQMLMGAISSAVAGYAFKGLPAGLHIFICIVTGAIVGGAWAFIPAILKVLRGVHEVITTIMMNYISYSFIAYIVERLKETPSMSQTPTILNSAQLPKIGEWLSIFKDSSLNLSLILAIIVSIFIYFMIYKTVIGYEIRAVGISKNASENAGIKVSKNIILAMLISGMIAGIAGSTEVLGIKHKYVIGLLQGYGFEGIAVALMASTNPIGVIFAGIMFGALSSGGLYMDMAANVPKDIALVIQGLIVFFIAGNGIIKFVFSSKKGAI